MVTAVGQSDRAVPLRFPMFDIKVSFMATSENKR